MSLPSFSNRNGSCNVVAARKRSHQWCLTLTPNNTETIGRMTCHCFLRPIRRDLTSSSYTTDRNKSSIISMIFFSWFLKFSLNELYLILEWINRCEYTCQYIKGTVPEFCLRSCTLRGKVKNRSATLRTQGNSLPHCSYRLGYKVKKAGAGPASCTEENTVFPE